MESKGPTEFLRQQWLTMMHMIMNFKIAGIEIVHIQTISFRIAFWNEIPTDIILGSNISKFEGNGFQPRIPYLTELSIKYKRKIFSDIQKLKNWLITYPSSEATWGNISAKWGREIREENTKIRK